MFNFEKYWKKQGIHTKPEIIGMSFKEVAKGERNGIKEGDYLTVFQSIEKLLARYFGVDLDKAEKEKRAILESLSVEKTQPA